MKTYALIALLTIGAPASAEVLLKTATATDAGGLDVTVTLNSAETKIKFSELRLDKTTTVQSGLWSARARLVDAGGSGQMMTILLNGQGFTSSAGISQTGLFVLLNQGGAWTILNDGRRPVVDSSATFDDNFSYFKDRLQRTNGCTEVNALMLLMSYAKTFPDRNLARASRDVEKDKFKRGANSVCATLPDAETRPADVTAVTPAPVTPPPAPAPAKPNPAPRPVQDAYGRWIDQRTGEQVAAPNGARGQSRYDDERYDGRAGYGRTDQDYDRRGGYEQRQQSYGRQQEYGQPQDYRQQQNYGTDQYDRGYGGGYSNGGYGR